MSRSSQGMSAVRCLSLWWKHTFRKSQPFLTDVCKQQLISWLVVREQIELPQAKEPQDELWQGGKRPPMPWSIMLSGKLRLDPGSAHPTENQAENRGTHTLEVTHTHDHLGVLVPVICGTKTPVSSWSTTALSFETIFPLIQQEEALCAVLQSSPMAGSSKWRNGGGERETALMGGGIRDNMQTRVEGSRNKGGQRHRQHTRKPILISFARLATAGSPVHTRCSRSLGRPGPGRVGHGGRRTHAL